MSVPLYTEGFPERPAYAEALTYALRERANAGELEEAVRLCVPGRLVSFGKLDAFAPGFEAAVAAAERAGYAAVHAARRRARGGVPRGDGPVLARRARCRTRGPGRTSATAGWRTR